MSPHPQGHTVFELAGKTILIIGVVAVGQRVAKVAHAFGMDVIGVRRNPAIPLPGAIHVVGPQDLRSVLREAAFVVLSTPLTPTTWGMIGENELLLMKPSAYLINVGRGQLVDERMLVAALEKGWIAGAGLDVFDQEPLPPSSPLWGMENVIITAHYAGNTPRYNERAMKIFMENVRRYGRAEPLMNVVDRSVGY